MEIVRTFAMHHRLSITCGVVAMFLAGWFFCVHRPLLIWIEAYKKYNQTIHTAEIEKNELHVTLQALGQAAKYKRDRGLGPREVAVDRSTLMMQQLTLLVEKSHAQLLHIKMLKSNKKKGEKVLSSSIFVPFDSAEQLLRSLYNTQWHSSVATLCELVFNHGQETLTFMISWTLRE